MGKYILEKELKRVVYLSYIMIIYLLIFIPFVAIDMYHVINSSIDNAMNIFNTMNMVESAPTEEVKKSFMVKIGSVNLGSLSGFFFQVLVFSAIRLKKPYKNRAYNISRVMSILALLAAIMGVIYSDNKSELFANLVLLISSSAFVVLLFNKKVKKWSAELYIPPPVI